MMLALICPRNTSFPETGQLMRGLWYVTTPCPEAKIAQGKVEENYALPPNHSRDISRGSSHRAIQVIEGAGVVPQTDFDQGTVIVQRC